MKPKAIISDLDGTACDNSEEKIRMAIEGDWDGFTEQCRYDGVHEWCSNIIKLFFASGYHIFYLTSRQERMRENTEYWLKKHSLWFGNQSTLIMREEDCKTKDTLLKPDLYMEHIEPYYDVEFMLEDRKRVVKAFRDIGITVLQCSEGDF